VQSFSDETNETNETNEPNEPRPERYGRPDDPRDREGREVMQAWEDGNRFRQNQNENSQIRGILQNAERRAWINDFIKKTYTINRSAFYHGIPLSLKMEEILRSEFSNYSYQTSKDAIQRGFPPLVVQQIRNLINDMLEVHLSVLSNLRKYEGAIDLESLYKFELDERAARLRWPELIRTLRANGALDQETDEYLYDFWGSITPEFSDEIERRIRRENDIIRQYRQYIDDVERNNSMYETIHMVHSQISQQGFQPSEEIDRNIREIPSIRPAILYIREQINALLQLIGNDHVSIRNRLTRHLLENNVAMERADQIIQSQGPRVFPNQDEVFARVFPEIETELNQQYQLLEGDKNQFDETHRKLSQGLRDNEDAMNRMLEGLPRTNTAETEREKITKSIDLFMNFIEYEHEFHRWAVGLVGLFNTRHEELVVKYNRWNRELRTGSIHIDSMTGATVQRVVEQLEELNAIRRYYNSRFAAGMMDIRRHNNMLLEWEREDELISNRGIRIQYNTWKDRYVQRIEWWRDQLNSWIGPTDSRPLSSRNTLLISESIPSNLRELLVSRQRRDVPDDDYTTPLRVGDVTLDPRRLRDDRVALGRRRSRISSSDDLVIINP
jgi:hypothetical protein